MLIGGSNFFLLLLLIISTESGAFISRSVKARSLSIFMNYGFIFTPKVTSNKPKLILISGT